MVRRKQENRETSLSQNRLRVATPTLIGGNPFPLPIFDLLYGVNREGDASLQEKLEQLLHLPLQRYQEKVMTKVYDLGLEEGFITLLYYGPCGLFYYYSISSFAEEFYPKLLGCRVI